jgi:hypothetical protein
VPLQVDETGKFSDGLAPVQIGNKWGYIDKAGKIAINPQLDTAGAFSDGLAWVKFSCFQEKHFV